MSLRGDISSIFTWFTPSHCKSKSIEFLDLLFFLVNIFFECQVPLCGHEMGIASLYLRSCGLSVLTPRREKKIGSSL